MTARGQRYPGGMDATTDPSVIVGTVRLTERELRTPIVEMSWLYRWRRIITVIAAINVGSFTFMGASLRENYQPLLCLGVFLALLYAGPWIAARRILRALTRGGDADVSYRFDDEGVTVRSAGATASFAYRRLIKAREGSTAFLLYCSPMVANIVPKSAFAAGEVDRVRALIAAHVAPKPLRGRGGKILIVWLVLVFAFVVVWQLLNARPSQRQAGPASGDVHAD